MEFMLNRTGKTMDREQLDKVEKMLERIGWNIMNKVEENKKMDEIKQELFELRMYIEDQYTERYGWSVDGEEVLKRVYQLMELVHGKKVEEPLVEYEDEWLDVIIWWKTDFRGDANET